MKHKGYRRDTAFLYPDLEKISPEERMRTLELITQITAIVNMANRELKELVDGGTFSFVNCMPMVHMECISDIPPMFTDRNNVRICIANFDGYDYTENYRNLINEYKQGKTGISHLVALHITTPQQKVRFCEDKQGEFDAVITANLDHLGIILVSIMFDISIYHYYGLNDNLQDRKIFNEIKYTYLSKKYDKKEQEELYGSVFPDVPIYLPISLPAVRKIDRRIRRDRRQEAVNEMLESFATFLAKSSMALEVTKDCDGDMLGPHSHIPHDIFETVVEIIHQNKNLEEYVIIFLSDSTGNYRAQVLEYTKAGNLPCWIDKNCEGEALYKIISVKQGRL